MEFGGRAGLRLAVSKALLLRGRAWYAYVNVWQHIDHLAAFRAQPDTRQPHQGF